MDYSATLGLALPLGLAIALLQGPSGKINVDLPVRGNVNDPDFSIGGVVLRAFFAARAHGYNFSMVSIPADAEIPSHQLMLRAGMIRKLAAGLYTWLPLGLRVMRKVETIDSRGAFSPWFNNVLMSKIFFRNYMFQQAQAMRDKYNGAPTEAS